MDTKLTVLLELPVPTKRFGGIVGSRVELTMGKVMIQIAYLETGDKPRVRYFENRLDVCLEKYADSMELKLADIKVRFGDSEKTTLNLEIVCKT